MNKRLAAERTRMYAAIREAHPLYFGDPMKLYASGAAYTADPFGGPAYGEKNGSGGGFVGAILSVGLAVATGGASLGFTTLASSLTTISLISTVVGQVTGNKTFSTVGMLAGLGGTFVNLSGQGMLGDSLKGWANDPSIYTPPDASASMFKGADNASNTSAAGTVTADPTSTVTSATNSVETTAGSSGLASLPTDVNQGFGVTPTPTVPTLQGAALGDQGAALGADATGLDSLKASGVNPDALSSTKPVINNIAPSDGVSSSLTGTPAGGVVTTQGSTAPQPGGDSKSLLESTKDFANEYKSLLEIGGQGVKFVGDLMRNDVEARKRAYDAQANLAISNTATADAQRNNASAVPDITQMYSTNPNAQVYRSAMTHAAGVRPRGLSQTRSA